MSSARAYADARTDAERARDAALPEPVDTTNAEGGPYYVEVDYPAPRQRRTDPLAWAERRQTEEREATGGNWMAGCVVVAILVLAAIGLVDLLRWAAGLLPQ